MALDVDRELAAYRESACTGKRSFGARGARESAGRMRARYPTEQFNPYPCPFCAWWHIGHSPAMASIERHAALLRARAGNAPSEPGSGTTRRQRRKAARR